MPSMTEGKEHPVRKSASQILTEDQAGGGWTHCLQAASESRGARASAALQRQQLSLGDRQRQRTHVEPVGALGHDTLALVVQVAEVRGEDRRGDDADASEGWGEEEGVAISSAPAPRLLPRRQVKRRQTRTGPTHLRRHIVGVRKGGREERKEGEVVVELMPPVGRPAGLLRRLPAASGISRSRRRRTRCSGRAHSWRKSCAVCPRSHDEGLVAVCGRSLDSCGKERGRGAWGEMAAQRWDGRQRLTACSLQKPR